MSLHDKITMLTLKIDDFLFELKDILDDEQYSTLEDIIQDDVCKAEELLRSSRDLLLSTLKNV